MRCANSRGSCDEIADYTRGRGFLCLGSIVRLCRDRFLVATTHHVWPKVLRHHGHDDARDAAIKPGHHPNPFKGLRRHLGCILVARYADAVLFNKTSKNSSVVFLRTENTSSIH